MAKKKVTKKPLRAPNTKPSTHNGGGKLSEEQKFFLVDMFATYAKLTDVLKQFAERWPETTITKQSAQYYDPTTYAGRELAGSLKTRFNDVRERYREEAAAVPSTARAHRIRKLEELADRCIIMSAKAEERGNLAFAEKLLDRAQNIFEQIAKEMGDVYTNTHKVANPDGTGVLDPLGQLLGMIDGSTRSLAPKE